MRIIRALVSCMLAAGSCLVACSDDETGSGSPRQPGDGSAGQTASGGLSGALAGAGSVAPTVSGAAPAAPGGSTVATSAAGTAATPTSGLAGRGAPPLSAAGRGGPGTPAAVGGVPVATNPAMCQPAPTDASAQALMALSAVNNYRVPAGAGCAQMISEINLSATNHCNYYAMYASGDMCISNPHGEVMSCAGFTGAGPGDRMKKAGYMAYGGGEVMAFVNNPQSAIDTWVNSVWHRIPILDPWTTHLGYGSAVKCDTIDFGRGTALAPADTVIVYPYDGQINVPTSFNGMYEGPEPPAPASGWPSASPITLYAQKIIVAEHVLTIDGDATPIEHVWLDANATIVEQSMRRSLTNTVFMYANTPFTANTRYRVKVSGTYGSGVVDKEWTFTTGATRSGRDR